MTPEESMLVENQLYGIVEKEREEHFFKKYGYKAGQFVKIER